MAVTRRRSTVPRFRAAHPVELLLLNQAEDLRLQRERKFPDLVEEERAALGHFDPAQFSRVGAGKSALLVAEEFVLEERFRDRRAVDGDEGAFGAGGELMNGARQQFLSRSAFPEDQDGGVGGRHALDLQEGVLQTLARAHQARQRHALLKLLLEQECAALETTSVQGAVDEEHEMVGVDRLGEEVRSALADRLHRILDGAERGHDDDVGFRAGLEGGLEDVEAASRRELEVGEHHAERRPGQRPFGLVGVGTRLDGQPVTAQGLGEGVSKGVLVFDDEDVYQGREAIETDG